MDEESSLSYFYVSKEILKPKVKTSEHFEVNLFT